MLSPDPALTKRFDLAASVLERARGAASLRAVTPTSPPRPIDEGLDQRERDILDFERALWTLTTPKERAIRERFGFSTARYHQLLHRLIDRPEALAYDPMLVRRLRRVRDARRRRRVAGQLGVQL